jgi:hypothetical protein
MWLLGVALGAEPLVAVGESLGEATVSAVEEHPEYLRLHLTLPDARTLQVEISAATSGGACAHGGYIVQPRWELLGESVEVEEQPASVREICARLAARGPNRRLLPRREEPVEASGGPPSAAPVGVSRPVQGPPRIRGIHGVLAALLFTLPALLPGTRLRWPAIRELLLVSVVGVVARLLLSPRGPQIWDGADRLMLALGREEPHPLFGETYASVMSVATVLSGGDFSVVFPTNLAISALAPPLAWAVAGQLAGRPAALLAGLMMALLPVHLRLAGSEVMAILVVTLSLLSVSCALRFADRGETSAGLAAALSGGLVAHTRPEAIPFVVVPLGILLSGARRSPVGGVISVLLLLAIFGHRVSNLTLSAGVKTLNLPLLTEPARLLSRFLPAWEDMGSQGSRALLPIQLQLTPILWTALAALAVRQRAARWLVVWLVVATGAVLSRTWPMHDLLRFHLPAMVPLVLLAGIAGAKHLTRWPTPAVAVGLCLLAAPHLPMVVRPWAVTESWRVTRDALPQLPESARLLFVSRNNRGHQQGDALAWMVRDRRGVVVQDMRAFLDAPVMDRPVYALMSELCGARLSGEGILPDPCPPLTARYTLTPVHTEEIDAFNGSFVRYGTDTLVVGLYAITDPAHPGPGGSTGQ